MPYNAYLTDTDRAIDRDANEMLSPRANNSGAGYIAQGYANMDVLPEQLALADMLARRQDLSMRSRVGRKAQQEEDNAQAEQDEFDGYSNSVRGLAGLPETERVSKMRDMLYNNPSLATNKLVKEATNTMLAGDKAALDAKQNVLQSKQADLEMRGVEYDDAHFEEQAKLKDQEFGNARAKASLVQKQIEMANHELESGDLSKAGENIFNMDALGPEHRETRDKLIKTIAQLSTDDTPESRAHIRALTDITGGIAMGNQVKQLKGYLVTQNRDFLKKTKAQTDIDLSVLPKDRAQRDALIMKAGDAIQRKGGDMIAFRDYVEKAKGYNDSEEAVGTLTNDFLGSIEKLDTLRKSADPKDQQEFRDELNLLRAKSAGQKGHIQREYANFENGQKLREKESELAKRQTDMVVKLKSADLATRRDAKRDYLNERKEARAIAGDRFDRLTNAQKIWADAGQEALGLPADASIEQIMAKFDSIAPPVAPGLSGADME